MTWASVGLGVTIILGGLSIAGLLPHPVLGVAVTVLGVLIALWPRISQTTGFDPFRPTRVSQMAKLLRQAAAAERAAQQKHDQHQGAETPEQAAERGWLHVRVGEFLDRGFAHNVRQDFEAFKKSEEKKLGPNFKLHTTRAVYLERLARLLKSSDLAPGFVMPEDFSQFDHTKWPANNPG